MKKHESIFTKVARTQANLGRAHETPEERKARKQSLKKMSRHAKRGK